MTMKIGYLEVVEVKKIRSRNVCQLIVEADISQFKSLVGLDETKGVFIPCEITNAVCGALDLDIEPEEIEALMGITAKPAIDAPQPEKKQQSQSLARRMVVGGYFRNPNLWDSMEEYGAYTQKEHCEFVKGLKPQNVYPGIPQVGDTVAHHVRTAANSGTGIKPKDWFTVPLADSQHQHLHNNMTKQVNGELLELAVEITANQMRVKFKERFGLESMAGYTVEQLRKHEGLLHFSSTFSRDD